MGAVENCPLLHDADEAHRLHPGREEHQTDRVGFGAGSARRLRRTWQPTAVRRVCRRSPSRYTLIASEACSLSPACTVKTRPGRRPRCRRLCRLIHSDGGLHAGRLIRFASGVRHIGLDVHRLMTRAPGEEGGHECNNREAPCPPPHGQFTSNLCTSTLEKRKAFRKPVPKRVCTIHLAFPTRPVDHTRANFPCGWSAWA